MRLSAIVHLSGSAKGIIHRPGHTLYVRTDGRRMPAAADQAIGHFCIPFTNGWAGRKIQSDVKEDVTVSGK